MFVIVVHKQYFMETSPLLNKITKLLADNMGEETGALFYKFYELDSDEEILSGARSLLHELMGPEMTEKKLKELDKQ